jgi:hypothetical protein
MFNRQALERDLIRAAAGLLVGVLVQLLMGYDWVEHGARPYLIAVLFVVAVPVEKLFARWTKVKP